ncbi:hypothetical protein Pmani_008010 [Petrolisthes manimaculis]|uniref:Uncharacterized protein n=1 Tax=Petrolisthes manimaculis TaxID=1843537 RepID=A0AAE1UF13_9EUCA|nr:hypothetical protein Pmani_008010 [Petrolisthes manimaculis]
MCPTIVPPRQGEMTCSKGVMDGAYPLDTTCTFTCGGGAALRGSRTTICTPEAVWSTSVPTCQALKCSVLTDVEHGRVSPGRCVTRASSPGHHCYLSCSPGYRVVGNPVRTCRPDGHWSPDAPSPYCEKDTMKPFIQCPSDVKVELAPHQSSAYVRLPQPKANVDWFRYVAGWRSLASGLTQRRYVEASPDWAKQLEADLPAGKTTVTFMAHSPLSHETASCSFTVEVIDEEEPQVFGCPKSFSVQLVEGEVSKKVRWKEPVFKDNVNITHFWRSREPGQMLPSGVYPIHYVAMDPYRNRGKCSFTITVYPPPSQSARPAFPSSQVMAVCPGLNGGKPIHMFAWRVPPGCTVVGGTSSVLHAQWEHTLVGTQAMDVSNVVSGGRRHKQAHTPPPSVSSLSPTHHQRSPATRLQNERNRQIQREDFHGRSSVRGETNPGTFSTQHQHQQQQQPSGSSTSTSFLQHFPLPSLRPGGSTTLAFAHARARGQTALAQAHAHSHAQAHAHARVTSYG